MSELGIETFIKKEWGWASELKEGPPKCWAMSHRTLHRILTQHSPLPHLYLKGFSGAFSICWLNPRLGRALSFSLLTGFFSVLILVYHSPFSWQNSKWIAWCLQKTLNTESTEGGTWDCWHVFLWGERRDLNKDYPMFLECITMRIYSFAIRSMKGREFLLS